MNMLQVEKEFPPRLQPCPQEEDKPSAAHSSPQVGL